LRFAFVTLGAAALVVAGCDSGKPARSARLQAVVLGWHENCGTRADPLLIETRRLIVGERRWWVKLSFRNDTRVTLRVTRPHFLGERLFGLEPFSTTSFREVLRRAKTAEAGPRALADRFAPSKPTLIAPGEGWSGSFSGPGPLPSGTPIRVVLGLFYITQHVPRGFFGGFICVSRRYVELR
jgi:hypothetical protein